MMKRKRTEERENEISFFHDEFIFISIIIRVKNIKELLI